MTGGDAADPAPPQATICADNGKRRKKETAEVSRYNVPDDAAALLRRSPEGRLIDRKAAV